MMMQNPRNRDSPLCMLTLSIMGLVVLLAVGPQSALGRTVIYNDYTCTIRDSDDALVSCTGSGSTL